MRLTDVSTNHFQILSRIFCCNSGLLMMKRSQQLSLCGRTVVVSHGGPKISPQPRKIMYIREKSKNKTQHSLP